MANRLNTAAPEDIQLLRLMLGKLQNLLTTISSSFNAIDKEGIVVGTGIYQKDLTDSSVFNNSLRLRKIDEESDSLTYLGYSKIGTADSDSNWVLVKIESSGNTTSFSFAIDSWDNRTSASYL